MLLQPLGHLSGLETGTAAAIRLRLANRVAKVKLVADGSQCVETRSAHAIGLIERTDGAAQP